MDLSGSSPRVWGQGTLAKSRRGFPGIIPTRVGTRRLYLRQDRAERDHPHACGDKIVCILAPTHLSGSSPRVWGQVYVIGKLPSVSRIIPTRVGTRKWCEFLALHRQDHPHACGDKQIKNDFFIDLVGSSPRVWGQD